MIGTFKAIKSGQIIFYCEFPLEDEGVVGMTWSEGVKFCIDEFHKAQPGLLLSDTEIHIGSRV